MRDHLISMLRLESVYLKRRLTLYTLVLARKDRFSFILGLAKRFPVLYSTARIGSFAREPKKLFAHPAHCVC